MNIGLKLWSINENYIDEAKKLYEQQVYDYIELYVVPGSYQKFSNIWRQLKVPFVIHAPHFKHGVNPARKEDHEASFVKAKEAIDFSDLLDVKHIIFHPGISGAKEDTVVFFKVLNDPRILVENKPYYALNDGLICNGNSPEEIQYVMEKSGVGFCLDVGHAVCSARTRGIDYLDYIKKFLALDPVMYHFTDKEVDQELDQHLHFGQGTIDLKEVIKCLGKNPWITIEAQKDNQHSLDDFIKDSYYLKQIG